MIIDTFKALENIEIAYIIEFDNETLWRVIGGKYGKDNYYGCR